MSWCDLDFTFDLVIVTMNFKIFSGLFLAFRRVKIDIWYGHCLGCVGVHHGVTFNLGSAKVCSPYLRHLSLMTKIYGLLQLFIICTFTKQMLSRLYLRKL